MRNLAALTHPGPNYPAFLSINEESCDGPVTITVRSEQKPTVLGYPVTSGLASSITIDRAEWNGILEALGTL